MLDERPTTVLAFDPGRFVGVACVDGRGRAVHLAVVAEADLPSWLRTVPWSADADVTVVGSGTGAAALEASLPHTMIVHRVDETGTTLEARDIWRDVVPARGLSRWMPRGLRHPVGRIDDFAAWAIARRFLRERWGPGTLDPPAFSSELRPR